MSLASWSEVFGFKVKSKQRTVDTWWFCVTFEGLCEIEQMKIKEKNGKRILKSLSPYFFLGKYIQNQWIWTAVTEHRVFLLQEKHLLAFSSSSRYLAEQVIIKNAT